MQKKIKFPKWLKVGGLLFLMVVAGWITGAKKLLIHQNSIQTETESANPKTTQRRMTIGSTELWVEIRKTAAEQELGLSYRTSMGEDEGMAFVYLRPQKVAYWMHEMQFPLDFIWVKQGRVVEINTDVVSPTEQQPIPKTIIPASEIDMVVEVNAGWVGKHEIKVGDSVSISY